MHTYKAFGKTQNQLEQDHVCYREVDMSDLPSQCTQDIKTFRQILKLSDPRDNIYAYVLYHSLGSK